MQQTLVQLMDDLLTARPEDIYAFIADWGRGRTSQPLGESDTKTPLEEVVAPAIHLAPPSPNPPPVDLGGTQEERKGTQTMTRTYESESALKGTEGRSKPTPPPPSAFSAESCPGPLNEESLDELFPQQTRSRPLNLARGVPPGFATVTTTTGRQPNEPEYVTRFFEQAQASRMNQNPDQGLLSEAHREERDPAATPDGTGTWRLSPGGTSRERRRSSTRSPFSGDEEVPFLDRVQHLVLPPGTRRSDSTSPPFLPGIEKRGSLLFAGGSLPVSPREGFNSDFRLDGTGTHTPAQMSRRGSDASLNLTLTARGRGLPSGGTGRVSPVDNSSPLGSPRDPDGYGQTYFLGYSVFSPKVSRRGSMANTPVQSGIPGFAAVASTSKIEPKIFAYAAASHPHHTGGGGAPLQAPDEVVQLVAPMVQCDAAWPLPLRMPQTASADSFLLSDHYTDLRWIPGVKDRSRVMATRIADGAFVVITEYSIRHMTHLSIDELLREFFQVITVSGHHPHFVSCIDALIDYKTQNLCIVEEDIVRNTAMEVLSARQHPSQPTSPLPTKPAQVSTALKSPGSTHLDDTGDALATLLADEPPVLTLKAFLEQRRKQKRRSTTVLVDPGTDATPLSTGDPGGNLAAGYLTEPEAIRVLAQIMDALHYAHYQGLPHRSIHADNIFVIPHQYFPKRAGLGSRTNSGSGQSALRANYRDPVPGQQHAAGLFDIKVGLFECFTQFFNGDGETSKNAATKPSSLEKTGGAALKESIVLPLVGSFTLDRDSEDAFYADVVATASMIVSLMDPSIRWESKPAFADEPKQPADDTFARLVPPTVVSEGFRYTISKMLGKEGDRLATPLDVLSALGPFSGDDVLESTGVAVVRTDQYGAITSWNRAAEALFGYTELEVLLPLQKYHAEWLQPPRDRTEEMDRTRMRKLIGTNISILMNGTVADQHGEYMRQYRATKERHQVGMTQIVQCVRKNGTQVAVELRVEELDPPLVALAGKSSNFVAVFRDVRAEKSFEVVHKLNIFGSAIPHTLAGIGFVGIAKDGTITEFNRAASTMFGLHHAEAVGKNVSILMPRDIGRHHDKFLHDYFQSRGAVAGPTGPGGQPVQVVHTSFVNSSLRTVTCRAKSGGLFTARLYVATANRDGPGSLLTRTPPMVASTPQQENPEKKVSALSLPEAAVKSTAASSKTKEDPAAESHELTPPSPAPPFQATTALWGYFTVEQTSLGDLQFLSNICDTMCAPMVVMSDVGLIRRFSRAAEELFIWSEYEVLGKPVRLLIADDKIAQDHQSYVEWFKKYGVSTKLGQQRLVQCLRKDGTPFDAWIYVTPIYRQGMLNFVGLFNTGLGVSPTTSQSTPGGGTFGASTAPGGFGASSGASITFPPLPVSEGSTTSSGQSASALPRMGDSSVGPSAYPPPPSATATARASPIPKEGTHDDLTNLASERDHHRTGHRSETASPSSTGGTVLPSPPRRGSTLGHFAKRTGQSLD